MIFGAHTVIHSKNAEADRDFLRGRQYRTDANLAARQSIYACQHPRAGLPARVLACA